MATKLTKPVTRVLSVKDSNGVEGEIAVTISEEGVQLLKGRRKLSVVGWGEISKLTELPEKAPAQYADNKLGWLVELSKDKEEEPWDQERKEKKFSRILQNKFNKTYNQGNILVELPPSRRVIFVSSYNGDRSIPYFVSFPKIRLNISYIYHPNKCRFYVSSVRLCFFDKSQVYYPIFSNTGSGLMLCCNTVNAANIETLADQQIKLIFQSKFTSDLQDSLFKYGIYDFVEYHSYLKKWEKKTKSNPKWVPGAKELKKFNGDGGITPEYFLKVGTDGDYEYTRGFYS